MSENTNISVPAMETLIDYLNYQYPATKGDLKLKEVCADVASTAAWNKEMIRRSQILRCAFCGHEYPPNTPTHNDEALSAHIRICPKHPVRKIILELNEWKAVAHRLAGNYPTKVHRSDGQHEALIAYNQIVKEFPIQQDLKLCR